MQWTFNFIAANQALVCWMGSQTTCESLVSNLYSLAGDSFLKGALGIVRGTLITWMIYPHETTIVPN
jgi:hypothetical protein